MKQYIDLCKKALKGTRKPNRTGVDTVGYFGDMCKYDLRDGFPLVTTKRLYYKQVFAEMLGFFRGYDNAADFRELGCNVWNANANENKEWLANEYRCGEDHLGRIYGVQARTWNNELDQLRRVYDDLITGIDNRREIVTHWNPSESHRMALPPCHMFYQFNLDNGVLNMMMYQRSCDLPLGVPFNIAGYAWLLSVMAKITGHEAGVFTHMMGDIHVYVNQAELLEQQIQITPLSLPYLEISERVKTFEDVDDIIDVNDFTIRNYHHYPAIKYPFSV